MGNCNCHNHDHENIFMPREAEIVKATQVTAAEKHFTLRMKEGKMEWQPGQILEVGVFGYGEIPIGFASSPTRKGDTFDIVVRTVGRVSTAINKLNTGESMWVRGPLGTGFDLAGMRGHDVLIVAGGIGLCPTRSLIQYIMDRPEEFGKFKLFFGAKTPKDQLFTDDLAKWRCSTAVEYHETVDRADETWKGNVGVITTLFGKTQLSPDTRVVVCGPPIMYKFVLRELEKIGIPHNHIYLDLERRMKCGVGKCGHCQINDKYVCTDGPVFTYESIKHLEEAFV